MYETNEMQKKERKKKRLTHLFIHLFINQIFVKGPLCTGYFFLIFDELIHPLMECRNYWH